MTVFARSSIPLVFSCEFYRTSPVAASTKACNFTKKRLRQISICRWLFRKHNTINCDDNDDDFCFLILGRLLLLGSSWNEISLEVLQRLICVAAQPLYLGLSFDLQKYWRWTYVLPRQKRAFANYRNHGKTLFVFKSWCNCLILCESCCSHNWSTLREEKQTNNNCIYIYI